VAGGPGPAWSLEALAVAGPEDQPKQRLAWHGAPGAATSDQPITECKHTQNDLICMASRAQHPTADSTHKADLGYSFKRSCQLRGLLRLGPIGPS
jgi:hypothetical protein